MYNLTYSLHIERIVGFYTKHLEIQIYKREIDTDFLSFKNVKKCIENTAECSLCF